MSTKNTPLKKFKTREDNPRTITPEALEQLKNSLKTFVEMMEMRPLVVDEGFNILGGNQRLTALQELGYKVIPNNWFIQKKGLTEEQKKEFILRDNAHYGEWDWQAIAEDWGDFDILDFGISMPGMDINPKDFDDEFTLPSNAKSKNEQITFTFGTGQCDLIKDVIHKLKQTPEYKERKFKDNENSNGNALYMIVSEWMSFKKQ